MTEPILVVGAGPTGLMAALELSRMDVPVRVVDQREGPATTSRAIGIQARTLELMAQRGLADEMMRLGNRCRYSSVYGGGKRVFRLDFERIDSAFDCILFLSQAETERILREALSRQGVKIEWRTRLVAVSQDASAAPPVTAVLDKAGRLERVAAPWLVSAEGSHSSVRATLDLHFEGRTLDTQYALGDLHVAGELSDGDMHIFSSDHGFMGLFPMGAGHFRMIASHPVGDPARGSPPTEAELQQLYDQRSPVPARFHDTTWTSWFRINSRLVPRLRAGRFLLDGDAAHVHSPAGAQGMNTGLQDMVNLCWKLAMVQHGRALPALVDTYEQDRLPVMRDVLFKTENLTEVIGSQNPLTRSLFNHLGPWIGGAELVQEQSTRRMSQIAVGYREGPLSVDHAHGGETKAGDRVPPHARVKHRGPQGWADGCLADLLDPNGFVMLVAHESEAGRLAPALVDAAECLPVSLQLFEIAPPAEDRGEHLRKFGGNGSVFLVRPDGYVAVATGAHSAPAVLGDFGRRWFHPLPGGSA